MFRSSFLVVMALPGLLQAQSLPPELGCIPRDAMGFISIRGDLLKNDTLKPLRDHFSKNDPALLKRLETRAGFGLDEIARVTFLFPSANAYQSPPLIFVTLDKPYDKAKLLAKVKATSNRTWIATKPEMAMGGSGFDAPPIKMIAPPDFPKKAPAFPDDPRVKTPLPPPPPVIDPADRAFNAFNPEKPDLAAPYYYLGPSGSVVVCFDDRTLLFILDSDRAGGRTMMSLLPALLRPAKKGPLDDALAKAAGKHGLVIGANTAGLAKLFPFAEPIKRLLTDAESFTLTADLSTELAISLRVGFADSDTARTGEKTVAGFVQYLKDGIPALRKDLARSPSGGMLGAFLENWEMLLAKPTFLQKEAAIEVTASVKVDEVLTKALEKALVEMKISEQRVLSQNNLKQIGIAIYNYEGSYRRLPFPGINARGPVPADANPNLSWRVAILPFIGESRLYRQFKLDEPWDSEHNKQLIPLMPKVYAPVNRAKAEKGQTFYQIFQGASAIRHGMRLLDFSDGLSHTIFVVESDDSVPWTRPEDLLYNPKNPLPKLGGLFGGDFNVLMGDGSVRWIPKTISEEKLRAMITPDGGEIVTEE